MMFGLGVLGTWGCPWHGLIQSGQLTLPNAETLPMRQPLGLPFEQGSTHLISLPTAPVTERTEAQQEADGLAGRQWLNQALIAGDQIHGTAIGLGKWIYHDDDGKNWLVSTTLQEAGPAVTECTVTLSRFGVFGGAPQSYDYTVAVPGLEAARSYWGLSGSNVQTRLYSAHPQGQGAIFAVLGKFTGVEDWRPIAWQQMTLTGAAAECTIEVTVLHDAAATRGTETDTDSGNFGSELVRYHRVAETTIEDTTVESYPDCSGTYTATESYTFEPSGTSSGFLAFPGTGYSQRAAWVGCIVGVLYGDDGTLKTITLDAECDWTLDATGLAPETSTERVYSYNVISSGGACQREEVEATPGELVVSQTVISTAEAALTYKINDAVAATEQVSYQSTRTARLTFLLAEFPSGGTNSQTLAYEWATTRSDGASASYSGGGAALGDEVLGSHSRGLNIGADLIRQPYILSQGDAGSEAPMPGYIMRAQRHSNGLYGFERDTNGLNGAYPHDYLLTDQVATPAGAVTVPELSYTRANSGEPTQFAYGSYNPITGAVARALNTPVCWT